jgi:hypothetical protein
MKKLEIQVFRYLYTKNSTIGKMYLNGEFFCYTLEDTVRGKGIKIKAHTAIDEEDYKVIVNMSNRFKRLMPLLIDVLNFEGVRIHGGNTHENTEGCILTAYNLVNDCTIQGTAEHDLTDILKGYDEILLKVRNTDLLPYKEIKEDC